ncbi:MAG: branched-chain amino acid ABC transporter ATP-binding protein [Firmicutes bacterium ZCTH02-B6]|nr:MAG: branched-chain amino acid ABC transporter ATP-binding protein [Firmicutes bacterium ZCTH02-B6]
MLRIESIEVSYGGNRALHGVCLSMEPGEFVGVIGSNRAGKTTLLRAISGLVPLQKGEIYFDGQPLSRVPAHRIPALGIAHVPEGRQVFPGLTVEENLLLGAIVPSAKAHRAEGLEMVFALFPRLKERRTQLAGTMSGGEQQMLAIGRALMLRPRLLMLDEPSMGLAPIVVEHVYEKIAEIHRLGVGVLLIEQNVSLALSCIQRGYVIETGRVVLEGTAEELRGNAAVKEAYLGL